MPKIGKLMTSQAGEHYVAAELNRRGAYATTFAGNVPGIDIIATDNARERTVFIQVKTKNSPGNWIVPIQHGWAKITPAGCPKNGQCPKTCTPLLEEPIAGKPDHFWVFVSLGKDGGQQYYVLTDEKVRSLLWKTHCDYLESKGGRKAGKNHDSTHFAFTVKNLQDHADKWEILRLWPHSEA